MVLSDHGSHPLGVYFRHFHGGVSAGFDHEVVDAQFGPGLPCAVVVIFSEREQLVHVARDGEVVVRNLRLGLDESFGDGGSDPANGRVHEERSDGNGGRGNRKLAI